MPARRQLRGPRSPIRLRPDPVISKILDEKVYLWECDEDRVRGAHFVQRDDPTKSAILHRSTKGGGNAKWQVSFFDKDGAWGDSQEKTCQRALREHISKHVYRLVEVDTTDGPLRSRRRAR